ncbi:MAG: hypothetical protein RL754_447 [Bacteroidota bacterium]
MKNRKSSAAEIERQRPLFLLLGLALALMSVHFVMELEVEERQMPDFNGGQEVEFASLDISLPIIPRNTVKAGKKMALNNPSTDQFKTVANDFVLPTLSTDGWTDLGDDYIEPVSFVPLVETQTYSFVQVENIPVFQGCELALGETEKLKCMNEKLMGFVATNFKIDEQMRTFSSGEKVFVEFIIEKNGEVREANIARGEDPLIKAEALRIIKLLPDFTPAKINGKPVRMSYILPINIKIN